MIVKYTPSKGLRAFTPGRRTESAWRPAGRIIDSNVYVDYWERGNHAQALAAIHAAYLVCHSAVVFSELRRGARTASARRTIEDLRRLAPEVWAPLHDDWWEAGRLVRDIGDREDWETNKRREFQNDALIALTARRHGAVMVTSNAADFALLARRIPIKLLVV